MFAQIYEETVRNIHLLPPSEMIATQCLGMDEVVHELKNQGGAVAEGLLQHQIPALKYVVMVKDLIYCLLIETMET